MDVQSGLDKTAEVSRAQGLDKIPFATKPRRL